MTCSCFHRYRPLLPLSFKFSCISTRSAELTRGPYVRLLQHHLTFNDPLPHHPTLGSVWQFPGADGKILVLGSLANLRRGKLGLAILSTSRLLTVPHNTIRPVWPAGILTSITVPDIVPQDWKTCDIHWILPWETSSYLSPKVTRILFPFSIS